MEAACSYEAPTPVNSKSRWEAEMSGMVGDQRGQCPAVPCQHKKPLHSVCVCVCLHPLWRVAGALRETQ